MAVTSQIEPLSAYSIPSRRVVSLDDSSLDGQSTSQPSPNGSQPQHATGERHNTLPLNCDACPHCDDTCGNTNCERCAVKLMIKGQQCCFVKQSVDEREFTMCQVRRHGTKESAWLVAGDWIYDATQYIAKHPGGPNSILRKAGGAADCTEDLHFHSKSGQRLWERCKVGRVKSCPNHVIQHSERQWWKFWDALSN